MEKKFIRHLGLVGHIEDIAVDKSVQGKGFGKLIVEVLTALSESLGAYKVCFISSLPICLPCTLAVRHWHSLRRWELNILLFPGNSGL